MLISINGKYSNKVLIIYLLIIFLIAQLYYKKEDKTDKKNNFYQSFFHSVLNKSFFIFIFIFNIVKKIKTKSKNSNLKIKINENLLKKKKFSNKNKHLLKTIYLTLICFLLTILTNTFLIYKGYMLYYSSISFGILTYFFYSYFFQNKTFYSHHILSIFAIILINIPLYTYYVIFDDKYAYLFNFFYYIIFSTRLLIYQYIMEKYFKSFYSIYLIEGIMFFICSIIINIILLIIKEEFKNYYDIYFLINNLLNFFIHLLYFLIIYYYSTMNCILTEIVSRSVYYIFVDNNKDNDIEYIFNIVTPILTFIFILIYEEIIILNFCNLNKNNRKNMKKREKNEINNLKLYDISNEI